MAAYYTVKVLEECQVTPCLDAPVAAAELCLPLTFFDTVWFRFHPVQRIFFYEYSELAPDVFHTTILPKLKHSLSLTLLHFLPLAGKLVWPSDASKPFVLYTPSDGVALAVAESDEDFSRVSGDQFREAGGSNRYVPELSVTDSAASVIELQITYFPKQGFSIGVTSHHAILDGKSSTMFLKAWAHICKRREEEEHPTLPPELTPFLDRSVIQDPDDLAVSYLNDWSKITRKWQGSDSIPCRSVKLLPFAVRDLSEKVKATLELSREDIRRIRKKVILELDKFPSDDPNQTKPPQLSTFVLVYAYTSVCIMRARQLPGSTRTLIVFSVDCRARLEPPLPSNHFGNCVMLRFLDTQTEKITGEDGLFFLAKELSKIITKFEEGSVLEGAKDMLSVFSEALDKVEAFGIAGSNRFDVYGIDFGWGRPKRVEISSIDRSDAISLAESKDGSGGVEVGVVLKKHEMDAFHSLFTGGLLN